MLSALLLVSTALFAQSSNEYLTLQGYPQHGYIEIPSDASLDTAQMTVEAWVSVCDAHSGSTCSSIAGNGYVTGWWVGICGTSMRSYFNGVGSVVTGGTLPATPYFVHIAAVTDGTTRKHYINGTLVFQTTETAARQTSTLPIRIGSDPNWDYMAAGSIEDLRIWSVARTQDEIRLTMYLRVVPQPSDPAFQSLQAWYRFEGDATDSWRNHHGTITGTGTGFATGSVVSPPRRRSGTP